MLRLVAARGGERVVEPRCVGLWGLDPELAAYVERRLRARWPQLQVERAADATGPGAPSADLWICGGEPPPELNVPILWLGEIDRAAGVVRLGARLWKCSTPITGRQLVRSVDEVWRQLG
jgi:hypothetical protein